MENISFSKPSSHGRPRHPVPPDSSLTILPRDHVSYSRSRSSSSESDPSPSSGPTVTSSKKPKTWAETLKEQVEAKEADNHQEQEHHQQERRRGPLSHPVTAPRRRSRSPPIQPSSSSLPVTPSPLTTKCDAADHDPYYYNNYSLLGKPSDYDTSDFCTKSPPDPTLRSRLLLSSGCSSSSTYRYGYTTTETKTNEGSDGLFPRLPIVTYKRYPWFHLYYGDNRPSTKKEPSLCSQSDSLNTEKEWEKMFSLFHNPRTFLRVIVGLAFLMCFLTNMVSGGPLAERVRDAFHHRPWTGNHQDLRRHDHSQDANAGGVIRITASPALIDPEGVYIRASPLFSSSSGAPDTSRIIAAYAATSGPDRIIRTSLSTDSGTTWSPLGEVTRRPYDGTSDLDNAIPLALPSGRILLAFRYHTLYPFPSCPTNFVYTHYRLDVCFSDDGGRTWSFLSHIDERRATHPSPNSQNLNGLWEPFLRLAADGHTIQAYYSSENSAADQDNLMRFSTDEGRTWSDPPILVSSAPHGDSRDGMTGVSLVSPDPRRKKELICVFETTSPEGTFSIASVFSHDDGLTWGPRHNVYTAANKKWAGAPQVSLVGETLVVSFLTNEGTELKKIDGAYTKIVTSKDGGRSWGQKSGEAVTVAGVGSHWPGVFGLDERRFLALYSVDGRGAVGGLMGVV